MIVNTGRGALVDTAAVIDGLKSGRIGSLGLDVYEEEAPLFFEDRSTEVITDDVFARLLTFPNVLLTAHQAFFTRPALAGHRRDDAVQPRRPRRRTGLPRIASNCRRSGERQPVGCSVPIRKRLPSGSVRLISRAHG